LLIDEPTKGLAPSIISNMIDAFRELKVSTTLLVVEQNFRFAQMLGDTVAVMDSGRVVHHGSMAALADDQALQQSLLGLDLGAHQ
jgi:branched-chain amino acid transport system ATP-binding protein